MTDNTELKRLAMAAPAGPWYQHGGIKQVVDRDCEAVCETFEEDGYCPVARFIAAANPAAVRALINENEALIQALQAITDQVDGNIRPTVRDCVNGQNNVQDIYGYCDQIESIAAAAMKEPQP